MGEVKCYQTKFMGMGDVNNSFTSNPLDIAGPKFYRDATLLNKGVLLKLGQSKQTTKLDLQMSHLQL